MLQAWDLERCFSEANVVTGMVVSSHRSLSRTRLRLRIGAQTNLRVRWLSDEGVTEPVRVMDRVTTVIPAEAVWLEAGWFRREIRGWSVSVSPVQKSWDRGPYNRFAEFWLEGR